MEIETEQDLPFIVTWSDGTVTELAPPFSDE